MHVGVTGITGYVGAAVAQSLQEAGHSVTALSRRSAPGFDWRPYDLAQPPSNRLLDGLAVVVHCAYDLSLTAADQIRRVNVDGTRRLVESAGAAGSRVALVSSMSAYTGTSQLYGRAKLASETDVIAAGGNVTRLGLVYGGSEGGMIASLRRLAKLPIVPIMGRHSYQFMVDLNDVALGLTRLVEAPVVRGQIAGLAHPTPVPFEQLIRALARNQGRPGRLLPISWQPVYAAMRLSEMLGIRLPLRADSILGLVRPAPSVPNPELWARLGVKLQPPDLDRL